MSAHAPDFKPINADFGSQPGEGGVGDGMFFAKRPLRSDGMFYRADGAEKSTAGQDTDVDADKIDHALDELTDLQRKEAYANILKEATFSSAAKAGTVGALVGAAAGFAGGKAVGETSDEERSRKAEKARAALERAKSSEAGKAVSSARDTIGHIGRAGADAAGAVKNEIDKRASDAAFDDLEKTAGFLSLPSKAGVGKAVMRGLGYGGLGVGALGVAAGAGPGGSPLVDMQTGAVDVSGHPVLGPAKASIDAKLNRPASAAPDPGGQQAQIDRLAKVKDMPTLEQRKANLADKRETAQSIRQEGEWDKSTRGKAWWDPRKTEKQLDMKERRVAERKSHAVRTGAGLADAFIMQSPSDLASTYRSGFGSYFGGADGEAKPVDPQRAAAAAAVAEASGQKPTSGKRYSSGEPVSAEDQQRRDRADRKPIEDLSAQQGPPTWAAGSDWQGPPLSGAGSSGGGMFASAVGQPDFEFDTAPDNEGLPKRPQAQAAKAPAAKTVAPPAAKADVSPPAAKALAKAPSLKAFTSKPSHLGPSAGEQDNDPSISADRSRQKGRSPAYAEAGRGTTGTPGAEPGIAGPGAMIGARGRAPAAPTGDRPGMNWKALAETQFGPEIDTEYPGLDAGSRDEMLLLASQSGSVPGTTQRADEYAVRGRAGREGHGAQVLGDNPDKMGPGMAGRRPGGHGVPGGEFDDAEYQQYLARLKAQGIEVPGPAAMIAGR